MTPFYCWIPSLMSRLCSVALKAGIEVEYARTMIRTRGLVPEEPSADVASWPWPTRIFTLGRFEILVEDKPIDTTRLQKKPLSLLKALIALGGERVREESLSGPPLARCGGRCRPHLLQDYPVPAEALTRQRRSHPLSRGSGEPRPSAGVGGYLGLQTTFRGGGAQER